MDDQGDRAAPVRRRAAPEGRGDAAWLPALLDGGRLPIWELGSEGNRVRVVPVDGPGGVTIDSLPPQLGLAPRLLAAAPGGGFWIGRMDRYEHTLRRDRWRDGSRGSRPGWRVVALQDVGERAWGLVAAAGWRPTIGIGSSADGPFLPSATDLRGLFDTIVEVVDRSTRALMTSTRRPGAYLATADAGWAARAVRTEGGRGEIEVVRLGLTIP